MLSKSTKFFIFIVGLVICLSLIWLIIYFPKINPPEEKQDQAYLENRPAQGNPRATIIITEYSDFFCSYCKQASFELEKLVSKYPDKIKLEFRYYPLSDSSFLVARAAECAQAQNKFWPYHDLLFAHSSNISSSSLISMASQVGMDLNSFNQCLAEQETLAVVNYDLSQAVRMGVRGTPTIFVNGQEMSLSAVEAQVERLIGMGQ